MYLSFSHEGKVLDDGLAHVLQPLELHLEGLELGGLAHPVVVLSLDPVLCGEEHLDGTKPVIQCTYVQWPPISRDVYAGL